MSPSPADRRIHPRARFRGIAVLESRGKTFPCIADNLSESGMLLYSETPIRVEPGPVGVVFTLPGFGQWLTVVGEVVHQVRLATRTILGVHFTAVSDGLRDLLRRYVDATRQDLPPSPTEPAAARPDLPPAPVALPAAQRGPAEALDLPPLPVSASLPELPEASSSSPDEATLMLEGFDQFAEEVFSDSDTKRAVVDVMSVLKARALRREPR